MEKASAELVARFEELTALVPEADRKLVFGSPTCLVAGHMFFGAHRTGLFVRLPPEEAADVVAAGGAPFTPMAGRPMAGFYTLPDGDVSDWVRAAYTHAKALPPKVAKARKR